MNEEDCAPRLQILNSLKNTGVLEQDIRLDDLPHLEEEVDSWVGRLKADPHQLHLALDSFKKKYDMHVDPGLLREEARLLLSTLLDRNRALSLHTVTVLYGESNSPGCGRYLAAFLLLFGRVVALPGRSKGQDRYSRKDAEEVIATVDALLRAQPPPEERVCEGLALRVKEAAKIIGKAFRNQDGAKRTSPGANKVIAQALKSEKTKSKASTVLDVCAKVVAQLRGHLGHQVPKHGFERLREEARGGLIQGRRGRQDAIIDIFGLNSEDDAWKLSIDAFRVGVTHKLVIAGVFVGFTRSDELVKDAERLANAHRPGHPEGPRLEWTSTEQGPGPENEFVNAQILCHVENKALIEALKAAGTKFGRRWTLSVLGLFEPKDLEREPTDLKHEPTDLNHEHTDRKHESTDLKHVPKPPEPESIPLKHLIVCVQKLLWNGGDPPPVPPRGAEAALFRLVQCRVLGLLPHAKDSPAKEEALMQTLVEDVKEAKNWPRFSDAFSRAAEKNKSWKAQEALNVEVLLQQLTESFPDVVLGPGAGPAEILWRILGGSGEPFPALQTRPLSPSAGRPSTPPGEASVVAFPKQVAPKTPASYSRWPRKAVACFVLLRLLLPALGAAFGAPVGTIALFKDVTGFVLILQNVLTAHNLAELIVKKYALSDPVEVAEIGTLAGEAQATTATATQRCKELVRRLVDYGRGIGKTNPLKGRSRKSCLAVVCVCVLVMLKFSVAAAEVSNYMAATDELGRQISLTAAGRGAQELTALLGAAPNLSAAHASPKSESPARRSNERGGKRRRPGPRSRALQSLWKLGSSPAGPLGS